MSALSRSSYNMKHSFVVHGRSWHSHHNAKWCELEKAPTEEQHSVHMCTWPHRRVLFVCALYVSLHSAAGAVL